MEKSVSGVLRGKVQGVMFRQTFIRALLKNNLKGGATNSKGDKNEVSFTIIGDENIVDVVLKRLEELDQLNSWGAQVQKLEILDEVVDISEHEVTTENVDTFNYR